MSEKRTNTPYVPGSMSEPLTEIKKDEKPETKGAPPTNITPNTGLPITEEKDEKKLESALPNELSASTPIPIEEIKGI